LLSSFLTMHKKRLRSPAHEVARDHAWFELGHNSWAWVRSRTIRSSFQTASLRKIRSPASLNRHASAAHSAVGCRARTTYGPVTAGTCGTHSIRAGCALPAFIGGLRPNASGVPGGRHTRTGMGRDSALYGRGYKR